MPDRLRPIDAAQCCAALCGAEAAATTDATVLIQEDAMANPAISSGPLTGPNAAAGPLVVSAANPRYFAVAGGGDGGRRVVYLTGSHIWNNLHDGLGPGGKCAREPSGTTSMPTCAFSRSTGTTSSGSGDGSSSGHKPT